MAAVLPIAFCSLMQTLIFDIVFNCDLLKLILIVLFKVIYYDIVYIYFNRR